MIAVIGAGFSGLTTSFFLKEKGRDVVLFEANTIGGDIDSCQIDNFILDVGSIGIYSDNVLLPYLVQKLNLESELLRASKNLTTAFIPKSNYLYKSNIYSHKLASNSIFSLGEKIKIYRAMQKRFSIWETISIHDFFKNIFGSTASEYLASVIARGYFLSEANDLEVKAAFPDIYSQIQQKKSLKEAFTYLKEKEIVRNHNFKTQLGYDHPIKDGLYSFKDGLTTITKALSKYLTNHNTKIISEKIIKIIPVNNSEYYLCSKNNKHGPFKQVIFTTKAEDTSLILKDHLSNLSILFKQQQPSYYREVFHVWNKKDFSSNGHGIYWPSISQSPILNTIFTSSLFSREYSSKYLVTKNYMLSSSILNESELEKISLDFFKRYFKIQKQPILTKTYTPMSGLPKFSNHYSEWQNTITTSLKKEHPNIHLHGTYFNGIHLHQLLESSYRLSQTI